MATPPESTKASLGQRLHAHARKRWPVLAEVTVRHHGASPTSNCRKATDTSQTGPSYPCAGCATTATPTGGASRSGWPAKAATRTRSYPAGTPSAPPKKPSTAPAASTSTTPPPGSPNADCRIGRTGHLARVPTATEETSAHLQGTLNGAIWPRPRRTSSADEPLLRRDFPGGGCTGEDLGGLVADQLTGDFRQAIVVGEPPEQGVGVEQDLHQARSQASNSSAGSGSKKASPTRPGRPPGCRPPVGLASGINRAYGLPAFATMISCPAWACSSSLENCVLASCTFTIVVKTPPNQT